METTQQQPPLAALEEAPERPRSGYARKKEAMRRLWVQHEALKAEHQRLQREHAAVKTAHQELQTSFDELLKIHGDLLLDLKRSHQARAAAPLAGFGLMGPRHG
jgi:hypothetical protein